MLRAYISSGTLGRPLNLSLPLWDSTAGLTFARSVRPPATARGMIAALGIFLAALLTSSVAEAAPAPPGQRDACQHASNGLPSQVLRLLSWRSHTVNPERADRCDTQDSGVHRRVPPRLQGQRPSESDYSETVAVSDDSAAVGGELDRLPHVLEPLSMLAETAGDCPTSELVSLRHLRGPPTLSA